MEVFEAIKARRSIRRFTNTPIPENVMVQALEAAILAPNSSNSQTWDFYWVHTEEKRKKLAEACLSQSAARTAQELVVVVADSNNYKRSWPFLKKYVDDIQAPTPVKDYYNKLFPYLYKAGFLNILGLFKKAALNIIGLTRPSPRGPSLQSEINTVCIKSAALAAENFVLAITAQGFQTCMMEGFDSVRVKSLLDLKCSAQVVMVIAVGEPAEAGTWGPQFRIPSNLVIHKI